MFEAFLLDEQVHNFPAFLPVLPNSVTSNEQKVVSWTSCKGLDVRLACNNALIPLKIFMVFQFKVSKGSWNAQYIIYSTSVNITIGFLDSLDFWRILRFMVFWEINGVTTSAQNTSGVSSIGHKVKFLSN